MFVHKVADSVKPQGLRAHQAIEGATAQGHRSAAIVDLVRRQATDGQDLLGDVGKHRADVQRVYVVVAGKAAGVAQGHVDLHVFPVGGIGVGELTAQGHAH